MAEQTHIVRCEDPTYLPFARARIAALRATGIKYASQNFEVGGSNIAVRIANEHSYVDISGGSSSLGMDSGVVAMGGYIPTNPSSFLPGILHRTSGVQSYVAPFTEPVGSAFLKNPGDGNTNQIAGTIERKGGKISGKVPLNSVAAKSFSPISVKQAGEGDAEPTWVPSEADENVQIKKVTALLCPASVFTGKTRLYVQAMYGAPLYLGERVNNDGEATTEGTHNPGPSLGPNIGNNIAPALRVPPYRRTDDPASADYDRVDLTTSSGVRLDPKTGKHWLICVPATTDVAVEIYPLVSSKYGESLRSALKTSNPWKLSATDREHLEAYILAYSLPDVKNRKIVSGVGTVSGTWSMGYGWHWNWSGDQADMVVQGYFGQPEVGGFSMTAMVATHYRISVTETGGEWGATLATISGPTEWTFPRGAWCITEPNFSNMMLSKITPRRTTLFDCDAPFYAFYLRDELQLCSVKLQKVIADAPSRVASPGFANSTPYSFIYGGVIAFGSGLCQDWTPDSDHWTGQITCGGMVSAKLELQHSRSGSRHTVNNMAFLGTYGSDNATDAGTYGTNTLPDGTTFFGYVASPDTGFVEVDRTVVATNEDWGSNATVVVPPNDSQAIYMRTESLNRKWGSGTKERVATNGAYGWEWVRRYNVVFMPGYISGSYVVYGTDALTNHGGGTIVSTVPVVEPVVETYTNQSSSLLCCAGVVDVTWGSLDQFHGQPEDEVIATFTTLSSAGEVTPAVIAPMRVVPSVNAPPVDTVATPAFVGWA